MKRVLVTAVVALVLVALYIGLRNRQQTTEVVEEESKRVLPVIESEITAVEVHRFAQEPSELRFEKRGGAWWIVQPESYRARESAIDSLVSQLAGKSYDSAFPTDDLVQFGLDPARFVVTFAAGTSTSVLVGDQTAIGGKQYFYRSDAGVMTVKGNYDYHFNKELDEYRDKAVFWSFPQTAASISVVSGATEWQYTYKDGDWWSGGEELDTGKVDALLERVRGMKVREFTWTRQELEITNRIAVAGDDGAAVEIHFGPINDSLNAYHAYLPEREQWFTVADFVYENLWKGPGELTVQVTGSAVDSTEP